MNENPGGTPNPLNPSPSVAPTGAAPAGVTPAPGGAQPVAPTPTQPTPTAQPVAPATQPIAATTQPVATAQPVAPTQTQPATSVSVGEQLSAELAKEDLKASDSVVEPKKKSKKGVVIALVILLLLAAIGGAVAAILILKPFGGKDAVPAAISKLFSSDRPKNVAASGKITATFGDSSDVASLDVDFTSGLNTVSTEQYASATVTATFADESTFQFDANEIHVANGDLYLKVSGIAEALNNYQSQTLEETNCLEDESGMTNCEATEYIDCIDETGEGCVVASPSESILDFIGVFEVIDNEWIHISSTSFSTITDTVSLDSPAQCLIEAAGNLGEYASNLSTIYKDNPFVTYSTDNLKIAQKKNPLYLLSFDANMLAGFVNAMPTSGFMNEMLACMDGEATNKDVTVADMEKIIAKLPVIYVEIDDQDNFTRVYLKGDSEDGSSTGIADISLSYPSAITVDEPEEYLELNSILAQLFSGFYGSDDLFNN